MRIGIDIRMWDETGIGTYIRHLIRELILISSEHDFYIFGLSKDLECVSGYLPENWSFVPCDVNWYGVKEQLQAPVIFSLKKLDVLHVPHFNVPLTYTGKFIATIHDITHTTHSNFMSTGSGRLKYFLKKNVYNFVLRNALYRSRELIVPSEYVKRVLIDRFGLRSSKINVTYEAADPCSIVSSDKLIRVLSKFGVTKRYFYYIGNAYPHKNLEFILRSFAEFRKRYPDFQLVLSGGDPIFWPRLKKFALHNHLSENVIYTGRVTDTERDSFYKGAMAYLFASASEGFGLPILEAMSCGCPVVVAKNSCLPEIAGIAADYFEPSVVASCVEVMERIVEDESHRIKKIAEGLRRVNQFSWKRMATQTLEIYERL